MLDIHFLVPTALLSIAALFDIATGKFPNWLFILFLIAGGTWLLVLSGWEELMKGVLISIILFIALSPLFFMKAFGGGDIKLLSAFSLFVGWQVTLDVLIYSLFWGLLIGLIKLALSKRLKDFVLRRLHRDNTKINKIPYTVAILLGWLCYQSIGGLS